MSDFWLYEPTAPRAVTGGIKAQNSRGSFAESWWGQAWLAHLEKLDEGGRLGRGRTYARKGQVTELKISAGQITAKVQGSRLAPYKLKITLTPLSERALNAVAVSVSRDIAVAARLMAGDMPPGLAEIFRSAGASLLPEKRGDVQTLCNCPDRGDPCKHVAAVYYLLAEALDRDPFVLLQLRGVERGAFLRRLGLVESREESSRRGEFDPEGAGSAAAPLSLAPTAPEQSVESFWQGKPEVQEQEAGMSSPPGRVLPLVHSLGGFPFWRGDLEFAETVGNLSNQGVATAKKLLEKDAV